MIDTISRATAIKAIDGLPNTYNGYSDCYDKACIIGVLEEIPPVDAVEVVRCKDCLAYDSFKNGIEGFCRKMGKVMCGSDFCSYAERRTDE